MTGLVMSILYIFAQRNWADIVYPAIAKAGLVESFDKALRTLSSPFNPYIHWQMDPVKCPVNSIEFNFFLSILTVLLYIIVSKLTCKEPFNLERMLHRGKYALDGQRNIKLSWTPANFFKNLIGITPEYSKGDKVIAYGVFLYSFGYGFGLCFLGTVIWNEIHPWPVEWWSKYFVIRYFVVPCVVAAISTVWFGIGGFFGLIHLFRDLKARKSVNALDDGRVEGSMSLADKAALEAVDKTQSEDDQK